MYVSLYRHKIKLDMRALGGVTLANVFLLPKQFACVLNPFLINKHLHTAHWFIKRLFSELRAFG